MGTVLLEIPIVYACACAHINVMFCVRAYDMKHGVEPWRS
jgi:hypothetical protein